MALSPIMLCADLAYRRHSFIASGRDLYGHDRCMYAVGQTAKMYGMEKALAVYYLNLGGN